MISALRRALLDADLNDGCDIDSMDIPNFIIALHKSINIDIRESDYPERATLNGAVIYLLQRAHG